MNSCSLLDDGSARYKKIKAIARDFTVCQIGMRYEVSRLAIITSMVID